MVIFHSYVSLPEGTLTVKPVEVESYRSPFTAGMFYSHQIPSVIVPSTILLDWQLTT